MRSLARFPYSLSLCGAMHSSGWAFCTFSPMFISSFTLTSFASQSAFLTRITMYLEIGGRTFWAKSEFSRKPLVGLQKRKEKKKAILERKPKTILWSCNSTFFYFFSCNTLPRIDFLFMYPTSAASIPVLVRCGVPTDIFRDDGSDFISSHFVHMALWSVKAPSRYFPSFCCL